MRFLSEQETSFVEGGDLTWGDVGTAVGAAIGTAAGGLAGGAAGALAGKVLGEYFGCESSKNICNTNYLGNLPITYTN